MNPEKETLNIYSDGLNSTMTLRAKYFNVGAIEDLIESYGSCQIIPEIITKTTDGIYQSAVIEKIDRDKLSRKQIDELVGLKAKEIYKTAEEIILYWDFTGMNGSYTITKNPWREFVESNPGLNYLDEKPAKRFTFLKPSASELERIVNNQMKHTNRTIRAQWLNKNCPGSAETTIRLDMYKEDPEELHSLMKTFVNADKISIQEDTLK